MTTEKAWLVAVPLSLLFWAVAVVSLAAMLGSAEFSRNLFMETKYTFPGADGEYALNQCLRLWVLIAGAGFVAAGFGFKVADEIDGLPAWPLMAVGFVAAIAACGYGWRQEVLARQLLASEVRATERQRENMEWYARSAARLAEDRIFCEANPDECNNVLIGSAVDNVIIGYGAEAVR